MKATSDADPAETSRAWTDFSSADESQGDSLDTLTRSAVLSASETSVVRRVVGLTIMGHPELGRLGERAPLLQLAAGEPVELSRLKPSFASPGESHGRPLADPHVSRRPLALEKTSDGGARLTNPSGLRAEIDGEPLGDERSIHPAEIEAGVVIVLSGRIVLLLHEMEFTAGEPSFGLIGESPGMRRLRRHIQRLADLDVPVLLRGETGTGKELVAHSIYRVSGRRSGPMVAVNMGALPPSLAAAELFGSEKGAFTGADRHRDGFFVEADHGTLFLDEIGETPPEVQPMLLRALEAGRVRAVGSASEKQVDVRIIAATDADLEREIEAGRFRAPLLHRLAGYDIRLPPLRERREDIPRLMLHFLHQELSALGETRRLDEKGGRRPWLPASIIVRFLAHDWPGNIRQLRNLTRQLVIASRGRDHLRLSPEIEAQLDPTKGAAASAPPSLPEPAEAFGRSTGEARRTSEARRASDPDDRWVVRTLVALRWRDGEGAPPDVRLQATRDRLVRRLLARFDGHEVERGGGFLLLFVRTADALAFTLEAHAGLEELEPPQRAAAGLFVGEVYQRANATTMIARGAGRFDVVGEAKAEARQLADLALCGQTLLNRSAFDLARQALRTDRPSDGETGREGPARDATRTIEALAAEDVAWLEHGTFHLDGRSLEIFEVGRRGLAPLAAPRALDEAAGSAAKAGDLAKAGLAAKKAYRAPGEVDEEELLAVLRRHAFRLQPAARALGISRTSLYKLIEASPRIRKAKELTREQILAARERHGDDRDAMAAELEVSRKGLSRRMTQLGF